MRARRVRRASKEGGLVPKHRANDGRLEPPDTHLVVTTRVTTRVKPVGCTKRGQTHVLVWATVSDSDFPMDGTSGGLMTGGSWVDS